MSNQVKIKITDLIGSSLCISAEDGQKIYEKIVNLLDAKKNVNISFENVTMIISLFLNISIGQLYGKYSEDFIKSNIKVEGLFDDDLELLKRVVDNAKKYYSNRESYDTAWMEEEDNEE